MPDRPSHHLPLLLFAGFRTLVDDLHAALAGEGHPDVRPVHGFALQALGPDGATAAELGRRLGVSKQAAGKTIEGLERLGYVERRTDPGDARQRLAVPTARGVELLDRSAAIFATLRRHWARELGAQRLDQLEDDLERVAGSALRFDAPGWLGT